PGGRAASGTYGRLRACRARRGSPRLPATPRPRTSSSSRSRSQTKNPSASSPALPAAEQAPPVRARAARPAPRPGRRGRRRSRSRRRPRRWRGTGPRPARLPGTTWDAVCQDSRFRLRKQRVPEADRMANERTESRQDVDPTPQPEHHEPRLADPGLRDLSKRDYFAVMVRGVKSALNDNVTNLASAVAYNAFLAIPSALLVALGGFSLLAGPSAVHTIMQHLSSVMPKSAVSLLGSSLTRTTQAHNGGIVMIVVGLVLALWSLSGAMQTVMWATNLAYERDETRNFAKKRLVALVMIIAGVVAFALVFCLL